MQWAAVRMWFSVIRLPEQRNGRGSSMSYLRSAIQGKLPCLAGLPPETLGFPWLPHCVIEFSNLKPCWSILFISVDCVFVWTCGTNVLIWQHTYAPWETLVRTLSLRFNFIHLHLVRYCTSFAAIDCENSLGCFCHRHWGAGLQKDTPGRECTVR